MFSANQNAHRSQILREFSLWIAVSAARQGIKVKGRKLYPFLRRVDLVPVLDREHSWSVENFLRWHENEVVKLANDAGIPVGWSAKLINMLLKTLVYVAREGHPTLTPLLHPPIDRLLIQEVSRRYRSSDTRDAELIRLCKRDFSISGLLSYSQYRDVIEGLSQVAMREGCTLFETESLWSAQRAEPED